MDVRHWQLSVVAITQIEQKERRGERVSAGCNCFVDLNRIEKMHDDYAAVGWPRQVATSVSQRAPRLDRSHTHPSFPGARLARVRYNQSTDYGVPTSAAALIQHANEATEANDGVKVRGHQLIVS